MEKSLTALTTFDLRAKRARKEIIPERKTPARSYERRVCPYPGCSAVVRRLHNHLQGRHKLKRDSERYRRYLKVATFAELPEDENLDEIVSVSSGTAKEQDEQVTEKPLKTGHKDECSSPEDIITPTPRKEKLMISQKLYHHGVEGFKSEDIKLGVGASSNTTEQTLNQFNRWLKVLTLGIERTRLLGNTPRKSPA